jgi:MoaA/NifB/PqqE/SkfB family radical SAM enzyme
MYVKEAVILPWSAQVELTAGCNLRCPYCYINAMPWKRNEYAFMQPEHAGIIAQGIHALKPRIRIELALRGEPTLNPKVCECLQAIRKHAPQAQIQMTSNGVVLLNTECLLIDDMFDAGLNILLLDCYEPYGDDLVALVRSYEDNIDCAMHQYGDKADKFSPWNNHGPAGRHIVFMPALSEWELTRTRHIFNQAGNSTYGRQLTEPLTAMCPVPWREISIQYDGTVPICCDDAGAEYKVGNALEVPIPVLWNGPEFQAARRMLRYGERWFNPCCNCDGPTPARNRAIPFTDEASEEDMVLVQAVCETSPRLNGHPVKWYGDD